MISRFLLLHCLFAGLLHQPRLKQGPLSGGHGGSSHVERRFIVFGKVGGGGLCACCVELAMQSKWQ